MPKKKVTKEQVVESYYRNFKKHSAVAKDLGISRARVRQICNQLGLSTDTNYKLKLYLTQNQNKTVSELSKELNLTPPYIKKVAKEQNIEIKKGIHPNVKHTAEKLVELYKTFNGHYSKIAKELGVPQPVVSRLFKNRGLRDQYPSKGRNKV